MYASAYFAIVDLTTFESVEMSNSVACGVLVVCMAAVDQAALNPFLSIPLVTILGSSIGVLCYRIARANGQKTSH